MIRVLIDDAKNLALAAEGAANLKAVLWNALINDSFAVTSMFRLRQTARKLGIPAVGRLIRIAQSALYGIEIDKEVTLGRGVYFIHTLGTVVGGDARIGDRVRFFGNNTIGTAKDNGYPVIEDDVQIGCGARILGPIRVGARSFIGANAVVLDDVPPDSVVVGIPGKVRGGRARGE